MKTSLFVAALLTVSCAAAADELEPRLIAHRGGVVDDELIENSLPALEEAIARGYWMVEVDIQESKDGRLVVHHDKNFSRYYADKRTVGELTWEEIGKLRSVSGSLSPLSFEEYARKCKGRIRVMLDTKGPTHEPAFYKTMLTALQENELLSTAYVIGTDESKEYFQGKARVGIDIEGLQAAVDAGENVSQHYFLFMHGNELTEQIVRRAMELNVPLVPSVNVFHYFGRADRTLAKSDLIRLRSYGVVEFQIDSVYDVWLRRSN